MMKTKTKLKLKNISKTATKTETKKISQNENHTGVSTPNVVIFGRFAAEIQRYDDFQMAAVRHVGFIVMSSYCTG